MLSSLTFVNAQVTTVTNLMTTSTTFVATSVSYWVTANTEESSLYGGSFSVPAASTSGVPCGVQSIGPFSVSSGDLVSIAGTTSSAIEVGIANASVVDGVQSQIESSSGQAVPVGAGEACMFLEIMISPNSVVEQGQFSTPWKVPHTDSYYVVFYNDQPSAINVNVTDLSQTSVILFTQSLFATPTVTMTKTVTQTEVAPTLIYLINDNIQLIVAVVLLCLVASALGIWRRTRRKRPESDTEEPVAVTGLRKPTETAPDKTKVMVDTKFCRNCGAKIPRDSTYCEECGTNLS